MRAITARATSPPRYDLPLAGDIREERVEPVGCFVLNPMPRCWYHLKTRTGLDIPQCAGAIVEMGVGGGVTLAPDAIDARLDQRERPGQRVGPRESAALDTASRRVPHLDEDRELIDFARVGDHQRREIMTSDGDGFGL